MQNYCGLRLFNVVHLGERFIILILQPLLVQFLSISLLDDQQVLRCRGWLNNSSLCLQSKNPAILPCHHQVVNLIVTRSAKINHVSTQKLTHFFKFVLPYYNSCCSYANKTEFSPPMQKLIENLLKLTE